MADDLESDEVFREACRLSAWGEQPEGVRDKYWDPEAREFRFPEREWPEGVDPFDYVAEAAGAEREGDTYLHEMLRGGKVLP